MGIKNKSDEYLQIFEHKDNFKMVPSKKALLENLGISNKECDDLCKSDQQPNIIKNALWIIEIILEDMLINSKIEQLPFKEYKTTINDVKTALIEGFGWNK